MNGLLLFAELKNKLPNHRFTMLEEIVKFILLGNISF